LSSILAAFVTAAGFVLCIALARHDAVESAESWSKVLMMPKNAAIAVAAVLILLDVACVAMAVALTVSAVRLNKIHKAESKKAEKPRFSRLEDVEKAYGGKKIQKQPGVPAAAGTASLKSFASGFRNYAAYECGLYYEPDVIRAYIAGMASTKLTILEGISGTGKTSLAYAFGKYVGNTSVVTPVQPSWKDRTDLLGYYNEFTGAYTETELLCKLYEANLTDKVYTVVLDEMNIARVEYYFAEFLSLLELPDTEARRLRVTSDSRPSDPPLLTGGTLKLPDNVWFAGTANNDDSTLAISDKVYDRAFVISLNSRSQPFAAPPTGPAPISASELSRLFDAAVTADPLSQEQQNRLEELDRYLRAHLGITFGNRTMKQFLRFVPVFKAAGGSETDAVDAVVANKILRRMDGLNPVVCRREAEGLDRMLDALFGKEEMKRSHAFLERFRGGEV
jgi:hypothetical protein